MVPLQLWSFGMLGVILILFFPTSAALDCYVCKDCEANFTSSNLVTCTKSSARCVKLVNQNQVVDRTCGEVSKCRGRDEFQFPNTTPRARRSISEQQNDVPKSRKRRQLLQKPKNKEQEGFSEAYAIHCCNTNECNGSSQLASSLFFPLSLLFLTLWLSSTFVSFCLRTQ